MDNIKIINNPNNDINFNNTSNKNFTNVVNNSTEEVDLIKKETIEKKKKQNVPKEESTPIPKEGSILPINLDFSRIAISEQDAKNGKFITVKHPEYWGDNGDLNYKIKDNIVYIYEGETVLGFTDLEGINQKDPTILGFRDNSKNEEEIIPIDTNIEDENPVESVIAPEMEPEVLSEVTFADAIEELIVNEENDSIIENLEEENNEDNKNYELKNYGQKNDNLFDSGGSLNVPFFGDDVKEIYLTSSFGMRTHPVKKQKKQHNGVDIVGVTTNNGKNAKIGSLVDGVVTFAGQKSGYGNVVNVTYTDSNGDDITVVYAHLKKLDVKEGDTIKVGDLIGIQGKSGISTAEHLHLEIRKNDIPVDPLPYIVGPNQLVDIDDDNRKEFIKI